MTDEDRKRRAEVLADIDKHRDVDLTIEDYNRRRFSANIITPDKPKLH
jgi:hypothetical protein